jgi:hypothetical protein
MLEIDKRPTLYFAVYVDVTAKSSQRAHEDLARMHEHLNKNSQEQDYKERFFIIPVRNASSKIELLYPSPFLSKEDAEELYQKYYERYEKIIKDIKNL